MVDIEDRERRFAINLANGLHYSEQDILAETYVIVQSMYLGPLRYWFYSVTMSKKIRVMIQNDSDILWWANTPSPLRSDLN